MRALLLAALAVLSFAAPAAERTYAALSLVGDRLLISQYNPQTGSRLDRNARSFLPLESNSLDRIALRAVLAAASQVDRAAQVDPLGVNDPRFYAAANAAVEQGGLDGLIAMLRPELKGVKATHWILVTKYRADTRAEMEHGTTGSGQVEGLGFYIDRVKSMRNVETGEQAVGFLAPFAYLRFTLVDAATGAVVRDEGEALMTTVSRQTAIHPWDALGSEEKVAILERLVQRAARQAIPKLLAP